MTGNTLYGEPLTPFQDGWLHGYVSAEAVLASGWGCASAYLANCERVYAQETERLPSWTDQAAARQHYEFLMGVFQAEQLCLNALIEEGY